MNKKSILVLSIFVAAFAYRIFLLLWQTYPPGTDIGFHASVMNSITQSGNTNFLQNFYQMGGEIELEFPGYHIFASQIIILTGVPNYAVQAIIIALFSSLIVLAIFLVTRIVWNSSAAILAALLVTFSASDIEIVCWGGYPNIIALFLITLTFYLLLKKDKITQIPFLVTASLSSASIFLTHSLSAAVFVGITAVTLMAVLIAPGVFGKSRKKSLLMGLPVFIGAILVSPFLVSAAPIYLNKSAIITGSIAIQQALLVYRTVPLWTVLAAFAGIFAFFGLSKRINGRFLSLSVFLLIVWLLVPLLLTQGYLVGLYVDSVRFPFFYMYPLLILFAVLISYTSRSFAETLSAHNSLDKQDRKNRFLNTLRRRIPSRIGFKTIYGAFMVGCLLILIFVVPIFRLPWDGVRVQGFYQNMDDERYQAIEWAKQNTPAGSLFVSDMGFGWWLAGFAQRPTLTNVDLQALSLAGEVDISRNASYLLDTDYLIDNGYIQVREDGGFINRHNPMFCASLNWTNNAHAFFEFNSSEITMRFLDESGVQVSNIDDLAVTGMQLVNANTDSPSIIVNRANSAFSYSEIVTVTKGNPYANMTIFIQNNKPNVFLDQLNFTINSPYTVKQSSNNTLATLDPSIKECGQLNFVQSEPSITNLSPQNPCINQLTYELQGKSTAEIQIAVGILQVSAEDIGNPTSLGLGDTSSASLQNLPKAPKLPIMTFDYKLALQQYNVSYIANPNFELNPKYAEPTFSLAFINKEVAIFRVEANATMIEDS